MSWTTKYDAPPLRDPFEKPKQIASDAAYAVGILICAAAAVGLCCLYSLLTGGA